LVCALLFALAASPRIGAQSQNPSSREPVAEAVDRPVFRATVDLVTVAAVVRDKSGKVVSSLTKDDFTVFDGGASRRIVEFQSATNAPINVALLVDSSGSMSLSARLSRRVGEILFGQLDAKGDDAALLTFDTRLLTLRGFTNDFEQLRGGLGDVKAFGATSIYDAIAGAAGIVDKHTRKRRALVVVTDGSDNWSVYSPEEVAWIASTIDVPVYILAVTASTTGPTDAHPGGELGGIARATGGDYFIADTETRQARAIGRIIEDLRHQYLIAFEPSASPVLRPIEIRMRKPAHRVRARQWYSAERED
jgi:Ca-activated chloride channel family protein